MQATKRANPFRHGSQNYRILAYLQGGHSLTQLIAADQFKVRSLTRRIADIRDRGYEVVSEWKKDANGADYTEYRIG